MKIILLICALWALAAGYAIARLSTNPPLNTSRYCLEVIEVLPNGDRDGDYKQCKDVPYYGNA